MARISFALLVGLCLVGIASAAMSHTAASRQAAAAAAGSSTALATPTISSVGSLRKILVPAIQTLIGAPLQLLRQLIIDITIFLRTHSLTEIYSMETIKFVSAKIPDRVQTYWKMLMEMESQCMHRTLCDLADYTSKRLPKWMEQIVLVYLTNFSQNRPHYQALINGLSTHQCQAVYAECDAQQFLARVRGNLTEAFATTVAPVKEAFDGLVGVTASTLNTLIAGNETRPNLPVPEQPRPQFRPNDEDEEEEEFERDPEFGRQRGPAPQVLPPPPMRMGFNGPPQMQPEIMREEQIGMRRPVQSAFPRH